MRSLRPLLGSHLSELDLVVRARTLLDRCRRLGATDPAAARRVLRRNARLVQPALSGDDALGAEVTQVLYEIRRACGELEGPQPTVVAFAWDEVGGPADLAGRAGGAEAIVVRCADGDLVSEVEAVCALAEGSRVVLAVVGAGPAMAVRSLFLERAVALLPPNLPAPELPGALEAAAKRLGLDVRRC